MISDREEAKLIEERMEELLFELMSIKTDSSGIKSTERRLNRVFRNIRYLTKSYLELKE